VGRQFPTGRRESYAAAMTDWRDVSLWKRLAAGGGEDGVVAAAAAVDPRDAASIMRLRRRFEADLVAAAIELATARRKAFRKFPEHKTLWCDVAGVEQASGARVAAWKALRMVEALGPGAEILDLCSGIGGDAMALTAGGLAVTAIDLDPRRAWMTGMNAHCATLVADVESIDIRGRAIHADPARRDERASTRSWSLDDHQPGRDWIERALRETAAAGIKFSPGVDRRAFTGMTLEWEWIQEDDALVQAIAWSGAFAGNPRETRATVLGTRTPVGSAATIVGLPDDCCAQRIGVALESLSAGCFISEPASALERAQLLTEATRGTGALEVARGLGLIVTNAPLAAPWFESFEFVCEVSGRPESLAVALSEVVRQHKLSLRSVRLRGGVTDADRLTRELGCTPQGDTVVFVARKNTQARAIVARAC